MNPNIVFLIIDSFRADKFFGANSTSKKPNIDHLIKNPKFYKKSFFLHRGDLLDAVSLKNIINLFIL